MSDHRALIEWVTAEHRAALANPGFCRVCKVSWPCLTARLADALTAAVRRAAELEQELADANVALVAEQQQAVETFRGWREKTVALESQLAALRDRQAATAQDLARAEQRLAPFLDLAWDIFGQGAMSVHRVRDFQDFIRRADAVIEADGQPSLDYMSKLNEAERQAAALTRELAAAREGLREVASMATQAVSTDHAGQVLRQIEQRARAALAAGREGETGQ